MLHIEKSAFRRGEYVGYAAGHVYNVRRSAGFNGWQATPRDNPANYLFSVTLKGLDEQMADIAATYRCTPASIAAEHAADMLACGVAL